MTCFLIGQSSYRKYHSTEMALLKVKNDILMNMNNQEVTLLVLLDLSAAFDTVDHSILLKQLQEDFGISGTVPPLVFFLSFRRSQKVVIDGVCYKKFDLSFLGSWFDSKLNMSQHINKTCSSAFFHLYNIRRIRKFLTRQDVECLVHALISSKIDYCNGLLYGIPAIHITKLQRVQNNAARLVTGISRFSHITPVLDALHWLPVSYRIQFKILLLTFKCIHGLAPKYLMDLINIRRHTRYCLRSCGSLTLLPLTGKCLTTLGGRAFKSAAPKLWNVRPANIRNMDNLNLFKKALKTYLFRMAFEH